MIIFDRQYTWQGYEGKDNFWKSSCWITIVDLRKSYPDVIHLKPIIAIASGKREGTHSVNAIEFLADMVCQRFEVNYEKIFWVELSENAEPKMEVAIFHKNNSPNKKFSVRWRPILSHEIELVRTWIEKAEQKNPSRNITNDDFPF